MGLQLGSCRKWSIGKLHPKLAKALMMVSAAYELPSSSRLHLFDRALDFGRANPLRCDFRGKLSMAARITLRYSSLRTDAKQTGKDSTLSLPSGKAQLERRNDRRQVSNSEKLKYTHTTMNNQRRC
jgi:hypothetical protein